MGMSASQARLLSITARLTNNEFRSQTITNSKLRLASESEVASAKYMDALNSKQLMFMSYDDNGDANKIALTPSVLYEYSPLKNQYAIKNSCGKVLVSTQDAKNFEETDTLLGFLKRYELATSISVPQTSYSERKITVTESNPLYESWLNECNRIDELNAQERERINNWTPNWDDEAEIANYTTHIYDWQIEETGNSVSLYDMFYDAAQGCYNHSTIKQMDYISGEEYYLLGCYEHVLAHMLDLGLNPDGTFNKDDYAVEIGNTTYFRKNFESTVPEVNAYIDLYQSLKSSRINEEAKTPMMKPISDFVANGYVLDGETHILYTANHDADENSSEIDKLLSNYYLMLYKDDRSQLTEQMLLSSNYTYDESGNIVNKTLRQKCIDLLCLNQRQYIYNDIELPQYWAESDYEYNRINYGYTQSEPGHTSYQTMQNYYEENIMPLIQSFQADMEIMLSEIKMVDNGYDDFDSEAYEKAKAEALTPPEYTPILYPEEPSKTTTTTKVIPIETTDIVEKILISDKDKAQWYVNLWYGMNGSDTANVINSINLDSETWNEIPENLRSEYRFHISDCQKDNLKINYDIFDDNLFTSQTWLQFALEHGVVTLDQARYYDPSEDSKKISQSYADGITWQSIAYQNAGDFVEVDDEKAIAIAEVKYKKTITEIENKDNKYDQDLKKLDTEHTALQTEYDSIKEVISKNVDRSFKAFS